jgi:hypothetical protein
MARIVAAGVETARRAGVAPEQVDVVYLTGGSTGLLPLATRIAGPPTQAAPREKTAGLPWRRRRRRLGTREECSEKVAWMP